MTNYKRIAKACADQLITAAHELHELRLEDSTPDEAIQEASKRVYFLLDKITIEFARDILIKMLPDLGASYVPKRDKYRAHVPPFTDINRDTTFIGLVTALVKVLHYTEGSRMKLEECNEDELLVRLPNSSAPACEAAEAMLNLLDIKEEQSRHRENMRRLGCNRDEILGYMRSNSDPVMGPFTELIGQLSNQQKGCSDAAQN